MNKGRSVQRRKVGGVVIGLWVATGLVGVTHADEFLNGSERDLRARERQELDELLDDLGRPDPYRRNLAVRRLEVIGAPAIPALREEVKRDSDPQRVRNACLALGAIGHGTCISILDHYFLRSNNEDTLRATLLALARSSEVPTPERLQRLRELLQNESRDSIARIAVLVSGSMEIAGLAETLRRPLSKERDPKLRSAYVLALSESSDPAVLPLLAKELRPTNKNRLLRRTLFHAVARLGHASLLDVLLKLRPRSSEEAKAFALALAAYGEEAPVERLSRLLAEFPGEVPEAVFALAHHSSPEAEQALLRALRGEYSPQLRAPACLALTSVPTLQPYGPVLAKAARSSDRGLREASLLTLAYHKDADQASELRPLIPALRDPRVLEFTLLACAAGGQRGLVAEVPPTRRRGAVEDLCRLLAEIEAGVADERLLAERVQAELQHRRAHWLLARDDLRDRLIREVLELDVLEYIEGDDEPQDQSGEEPQPPTPPDPGEEASPGEGEPGGGEGGEPPTGPGGEPGPQPQPGETGPAGGVAPSSPQRPSTSGSLPRRRGRNDYTRFESDLLLWLRDYPIFEPAQPFER